MEAALAAASRVTPHERTALKFWNVWIVGKFWWIWGANALLAALVLHVFVKGLIVGYVSSDNMIPWSGILLVAAVIVGGSLWLRSGNHPSLAMFPLLIALIPAVLTVIGVLLWAALYFLVFAFGHGRVN